MHLVSSGRDMPAGLGYISLMQCDEDVGLQQNCVAEMGRGMHLSMLWSVDEFPDWVGIHIFDAM